MKKIFALFLVTILFVTILLFSLCACSSDMTTTITAPTPEDPEAEPVQISYIAEFYDNYGQEWMSVEGTRFDISPNKVKEYAYNSDGYWEYSWATSSVMTISIDNHYVESCGSTVLFYDTRLERIETEVKIDADLSAGDSYSVSTPSDLRYSDGWSLHWWWDTHQQENVKPAARAIIIQSQNGDPICMFAGNEVTWQVSKNLPKTTEIWIDGMPVYVHRANFAIVDLAILS
jgi:hypothetical protein